MNVYIAAKTWLKSESIAHTAYDSTPSTNDNAKAEAFSTSEKLTVYLADRQSAGRGRGTNTWTNPPPGHSLMLTFSLHCETAPQPITAPLMGLAVFRALSETWPLAPWALKAPNDILLNGQKVCGILAETVQMSGRYRLVVGVGINMLSTPQGVPNATCIADHAKVDLVALESLLAKLVTNVHWHAQSSQTPHLSETARASLLQALNGNPDLEKNYVSITPAGDLVTEAGTISWRSL